VSGPRRSVGAGQWLRGAERGAGRVLMSAAPPPALRRSCQPPNGQPGRWRLRSPLPRSGARKRVRPRAAAGRCGTGCGARRERSPCLVGGVHQHQPESGSRKPPRAPAPSRRSPATTAAGASFPFGPCWCDARAAARVDSVAIADDGGDVLGAYTVPVVVHVYLRRLLDRGRRRWERVSGPHRNGGWRGTGTGRFRT
jgi:hypothetical protein